MFVKPALVFFALVAFVNAAPIVNADARVDVGPVGVWTAIGPGPGLVEFRSVPEPPSKRDTTLDLGAGVDIGVEASGGASVDVDLGSSGVRVNFPHLRRGSFDFETFTDQLVNAIGSDQTTGNSQYQGEVSNPYGSDSLGRKRGLGFSKRVVARDIQINSQVLAQLQNLVNDTVNLLRAAGNTTAVNTFLSQVNQLEAEVRSGTLDVDDLLSAAQSVILSVF